MVPSISVCCFSFDINNWFGRREEQLSEISLLHTHLSRFFVRFLWMITANSLDATNERPRLFYVSLYGWCACVWKCITFVFSVCLHTFSMLLYIFFDNNTFIDVTWYKLLLKCQRMCALILSSLSFKEKNKKIWTATHFAVL